VLLQKALTPVHYVLEYSKINGIEHVWLVEIGRGNPGEPVKNILTKANTKIRRCDVVVCFCDPVSTFERLVSCVISNWIDFGVGFQFSRGHLTSRTQTLKFITYRATFSMWYAIHPAKIRKHLQTLHLASSISTQSC